MDVNVRITDVSAERFWNEEKEVEGDVAIKNDLNLHNFTDIEEDIVAGNFTLVLNYEPSVGTMKMKGKATARVKEKDAEDFNENDAQELATSILRRCVVEGVKFSETVDLPAPVPLPNTDNTEIDGDEPGGRDIYA